MSRQNELTLLKNQLMLHKESYLKLSNSLKNSFSTVGRIMYQLENQDKSKNVEVDKNNVVEYLSHVGLKLERMLAFVQTKGKVSEDESLQLVIFRIIVRFYVLICFRKGSLMGRLKWSKEILLIDLLLG